MDKIYTLKLIFNSLSGKYHRLTVKNVREDIATKFKPLAQAIISSNAYDAGVNGDLTELDSATLVETISYSPDLA